MRYDFNDSLIACENVLKYNYSKDWNDQPTSTAYKKEVDGSKKAVLHYELLKELDNFNLLEINLETGRHHQIRCQLTTIGCHIKGDLKYGFKRSNKDASIHLHARKLSFIHPVKREPITIIAPVPKDVVWEASTS